MILNLSERYKKYDGSMEPTRPSDLLQRVKELIDAVAEIPDVVHRDDFRAALKTYEEMTFIDMRWLCCEALERGGEKDAGGKPLESINAAERARRYDLLLRLAGADASCSITRDEGDTLAKLIDANFGASISLYGWAISQIDSSAAEAKLKEIEAENIVSATE